MEEVGLARAKVINEESKSQAKAKKTSATDKENKLTPWQSSPFFQIWIAGLNEAIAAGRPPADYPQESCLVAGRLSTYGKGNDGRWSCGANDESIKDGNCKGSGGIVCDTTFFASANSDKKICVGPDRGGKSSATATCAEKVSVDDTLVGLLNGTKGKNTKEEFDNIQGEIYGHYNQLAVVCKDGNVVQKDIFKQHPSLKVDQQKACNSFQERYMALKKDCEKFADTDAGKKFGLTCKDATPEPPPPQPPPAQSCDAEFSAAIAGMGTGAVAVASATTTCPEGKHGPKEWISKDKSCKKYYCDNLKDGADPNVSACVTEMKNKGAKTASEKDQLNCKPNGMPSTFDGSVCGNVSYYLCLCGPGVYKTSCSGNDGNNGGNSGEKEEGWFSRFFSGIGDWFSNNWKDILKWTVIAGVGFAALKGMNSAYKKSLDQRYKNNSQDTPKTTDSSQDNSHLPPPVK
jgi:hypothetical protein